MIFLILKYNYCVIQKNRGEKTVKHMIIFWLRCQIIYLNFWTGKSGSGRILCLITFRLLREVLVDSIKMNSACYLTTNKIIS